MLLNIQIYLIQEFINKDWAPAVKLAHIELTKADQIVANFGMAALRAVASLPLSEVSFSLRYIFKHVYQKHFRGGDV